MNQYIEKLKSQGMTEILWKDLNEEQLSKVNLLLKINPCNNWTIMYIPHNKYLLR